MSRRPGTIAACRRAADAGADAVLVRTPAFFKARMTTEMFVRHYEAVADASPVPVLLYNVTMFTGVTLPGDAVTALVTAPERDRPEGLRIGSRDRRGLHRAWRRGLRRAERIGADALPVALPRGEGRGARGRRRRSRRCARAIYDLVQRGAHDEALALQRRVTPLAQAVGSRYGVPGLKAALDMVGYTGGAPRPPLLAASPEARAAIRAELEGLQVLA